MTETNWPEPKIRLHVCCDEGDYTAPRPSQRIWAHWRFNEDLTEGWDSHVLIGRRWQPAHL